MSLVPVDRENRPESIAAVPANIITTLKRGRDTGGCQMWRRRNSLCWLGRWLGRERKRDWRPDEAGGEVLAQSFGHFICFFAESLRSGLWRRRRCGYLWGWRHGYRGVESRNDILKSGGQKHVNSHHLRRMQWMWKHYSVKRSVISSLELTHAHWLSPVQSAVQLAAVVAGQG
jgi:hypothetical protein